MTNKSPQHQPQVNIPYWRSVADLIQNQRMAQKRTVASIAPIYRMRSRNKLSYIVVGDVFGIMGQK